MAMTVDGTYSVKFNGFNRDDEGKTWRTWHLVGVGTLKLTKASTSGLETGTATGSHRSSLNPMTGLKDPDDQRRSGAYTYENGTYKVLEIGPPLVVQVEIDFKRQGASDIDMSDTLIFQQSGPDKFWLISTNAIVYQDNDPATNRIDEVVSGEAVKVDSSTW